MSLGHSLLPWAIIEGTYTFNVLFTSIHGSRFDVLGLYLCVRSQVQGPHRETVLLM